MTVSQLRASIDDLPDGLDVMIAGITDMRGNTYSQPLHTVIGNGAVDPADNRVVICGFGKVVLLLP